MSRRRRGRPPRGNRDDLTARIDAALADDHPLGLLAVASSLLEATAAGPGPELPELLAMFLDAGAPQTQVLAWTMAQLAPDELLRLKVTRAVDPRLLPDRLAAIARPEVTAACQTADVLRDGSNIVLGLRLGDHDLTLVGFIDFNADAVLKDGFTITEDLDAFLDVWRRVDESGETEVSAISAADARAWLTPAIEAGRRIFPPYESESWPAMRPLLEWALRHCPTGGRGFEPPEPSAADERTFTAGFLRTRDGRAFADEDGRALLELIWEFGTERGYGDPLLLSPTKVEILFDSLLDELPLELDQLGLLPSLLVALVPYAHRVRGVDATETQATLARVLTQAPEYLRLLISMADEEELATPHEALAHQVGGVAVLAALDGDPLPDEDLDLSGIAEDIQERVGTIGRLCDDCCDTLFDVECRTAVRRLLHDVALGDPQIFRRRSRAETTAVALCWLVGRANTVMRAYGGVMSKDLMAHFGLTGSPSQRAELVRAAIGLPRYSVSTDLESTRYLTGDTRRDIIRRRDQPPFADW